MPRPGHTQNSEALPAHAVASSAGRGSRCRRPAYPGKTHFLAQGGSGTKITRGRIARPRVFLLPQLGSNQ